MNYRTEDKENQESEVSAHPLKTLVTKSYYGRPVIESPPLALPPSEQCPKAYSKRAEAKHVPQLYLPGPLEPGGGLPSSSVAFQAKHRNDKPAIIKMVNKNIVEWLCHATIKRNVHAEVLGRAPSLLCYENTFRRPVNSSMI